MADINEVRKRFSNDLFAAKQAGIEIIEADKNYSLCEMKITPFHLNAAGCVMGGAIYTLADYAFAVAANTDNPLTVTLSSNISFLRSVKTDRLQAECKLQKDGKNICFFRVNVTAPDGTVIAAVDTNGFRLNG